MYYLWINEAQAGPYTLQQLQSMWNAGQITALTPYWQEGKPEWLTLNDLLAELEPGTPAAPLTQDTVVIPQFEQKILQKVGKPPETAPPPAATLPGQIPAEQVLWEGHPTLWKWAGLVSFGMVLVLATVMLFVFPVPDLPMLFNLVPLLIAVLIFGYVYLSRGSIKYEVTTKRVSLETGIFTRQSRVLRIQDIRSIAATANFLGFGNIEFSTSASDDAEVIFHAVARAEAIRDLVKKAQS
jgi:hypothetical protein